MSHLLLLAVMYLSGTVRTAKQDAQSTNGSWFVGSNIGEITVFRGEGPMYRKGSCELDPIYRVGSHVQGRVHPLTKGPKSRGVG